MVYDVRRELATATIITIELFAGLVIGTAIVMPTRDIAPDELSVNHVLLFAQRTDVFPPEVKSDRVQHSTVGGLRPDQEQGYS